MDHGAACPGDLLHLLLPLGRSGQGREGNVERGAETRLLQHGQPRRRAAGEAARSGDSPRHSALVNQCIMCQLNYKCCCCVL